MTLLPVLPIADGEALTSYLGRVGKFHMGLGAYSFLDMIELSRQSAMFPTTAVIDRVAKLTGQSVERLSKSAIMGEGARVRSLDGEVFSSEFANFDQTSFCPACLLGDTSADSLTGGVRVGRLLWRIEPIRCCARHSIVLVRRKNVRYSEKFQNMEHVAPDDTALAGIVSGAEKMQPSDLQVYVENRLRGFAGPRWLDDQQIDQAARACEMLGIVMTAGTHIDLRGLSSSERIIAEQVGFSYASRGPVGVKEALRVLLETAVDKGSRGGPQHVFGRFYQWLQFNKNVRSAGPIQGIVREFILDNFAIEAGTNLFGENVNVQVKHSVSSLARKTGEHPKTVHRAAVLTGLIQGNTERTNRNQVFDAAAGEALVSKIQNSLSTVALPKYLNCNRTQAEQLVRTGVIPCIFEGLKQRAGVLNNVGIADADAFLERLMFTAKKVEAASEGMVGIVVASEIARCPVIDIIQGILDAKFGQVEILDPSLKFRSVLVNPAQVRKALVPNSIGGLISVGQAAEYLNMKTDQVIALARVFDESGKLILSEHFLTNGKGAKRPYFDYNEVVDFAERHVSLAVFTKDIECGAKSAKGQLDAQGVQPIAHRVGLGGFYYRRADLVGAHLS